MPFLPRSRSLIAPVLVLGLAATGLAGCTGAVVGGAAATGVAAYQERGITGAAKDLRISAEIQELWLRTDHKMLVDVGIEVYGGRVLLTGVVPNEDMRAQAVKLAWTVSGVQEVINEIQIGEDGIIDLARDTWITTQLKSKITFDGEIASINYFIETVNGSVYLLGVARNQAELDRVIAHAKSIEYVRKVVSHVKLIGAAT